VCSTGFVGIVSQRLGTEAGFLLLAVAHASMCVLQAVRLRTARSGDGDGPGGTAH
jgi:hypothetical protein